MASAEQTEEETHIISATVIYDKVEIAKIPSYSGLNKQVQRVIKSSSWWERYGVDLTKMLLALSFIPFSLQLLRNGGMLACIVATVILGAVHSIVTVKCGHSSLHGSFVNVPRGLSKMINRFFIDFMASYSSYLSSSTHIDYHHPYTNIIGLGDSTTWKAPYLSREMYLFVAPLFIPLMTPFVAFHQLLIQEKQYKELFKFTAVCIVGYIAHLYFFIHYVGFSFIGAMIYIHVYRAVFQMQYIHFNIFQHVGLPMYSPNAKPTSRVYLMSSTCLNLSRNIILDVVFGHSLINCHVEHHLFPRLSDNMCMKIKPIVEHYLTGNGLRYHQDSYTNMLKEFYCRYDELMVHAPPITHFVGIQ